MFSRLTRQQIIPLLNGLVMAGRLQSHTPRYGFHYVPAYSGCNFAIILLVMAAMLTPTFFPAASMVHAAPTFPPTTTTVIDKAAIIKALDRLPLYFIQNQGQLDARAAYYLPGSNKTLYFTPEGLTYTLTGANETTPAARWVVRQTFIGANHTSRIEGLDRSDAHFTYFKGNRTNWKPGVPAYAGLRYHDLWPGIDLVYRGQEGQLKYEFIVQPGADPAQIRLAYEGANNVTLNAAGQLEIQTPLGNLTDDAPVAYQEQAGERIPISVAYNLTPASPPNLQSYTFCLGAYDSDLPLIIDPVVLGYAGYIGGSGEDEGHGIAVDGDGNVYVTGYTSSSYETFPVVIGPDLTFNGGDRDAFVVKMRADGRALLYASYIGGSEDDYGWDIAVDKAGNAYVSGSTNSTEATFPVMIGPDLTFNGETDAFVVKVQADGAALLYASYIGGSGKDEGSGIAVDEAGNAYVAGYTSSSEATFPAKVGPDLTFNGDDDAFVAKVQADGAALLYAGYIGGDKWDVGWDVAVDGTGNAYVTGNTYSTETTFPATVGPDLTFNGGSTDAFVTKVRADGAALLYAGYIGGIGYDYGRGIAVDRAGIAYVTGETESTEATFPVKVGPDLTHNGGYDAFVAKTQADGAALLYAGYVGGSGEDIGTGIAVDGLGNAYVTGYTSSAEATFPVVVGPDLTSNGLDDAFVVKAQADGAALLYAGYIGGNGDDYGRDITVDGAGNAYVTGDTTSVEPAFPTVVGPDLTFNGLDDAFVAKIQAGDVGPSTNLDSVTPDQVVTHTLIISNNVASLLDSPPTSLPEAGGPVPCP